MSTILKRGTQPGNGSLKKCAACEKWQGILTFIDYDHQVKSRCKRCREHKIHEKV